MVEVEFIGGPLDGTVAVWDGIKRVELFESERLRFGEKKLQAIYRIVENEPGIAPSMQFISWTDTPGEYVEMPLQCVACGEQRLSIHPQAAEFPLQCHACRRMTCWPPKEGG